MCTSCSFCNTAGDGGGAGGTHGGFQPSFGPVGLPSGVTAGAWALDDPDHHNTIHPKTVDGSRGIKLQADTRVILVKSGNEDGNHRWGEYHVQRLDLSKEDGLKFRCVFARPSAYT